MQIITQLVWTLLILMYASAAYGAPAQVFLDNGELNYIGDISTTSNKHAFELFASLSKKPSTLNIRSAGGDTEAGIELGKWVHREGLAIKVLEFCFSSCANYVFTAARNKTVSNFAIVGYHGGLSSVHFGMDPMQEMAFTALPIDQQSAARKHFFDEVAAELAPKIKAEQKFFDDIGVQQRITTIGQSRYYEKKYEATNAIGWTFSVEDFAKLGVRDITVINPPWRPRSLSSSSFVFFVKL